MQMLYDSEAFVVVYVDANANLREEVQTLNDRMKRFVHRSDPRPLPVERKIFEIVDKRSNKEVLLQGDWADSFQRVIDGWHKVTPHQEEVEEVLDQFCELAQIPMVVH